MTRPDPWWLVTGVYAAVVFALSVAPVPAEGPDIEHLDKLVHLGLYLLLGWLLMRALRGEGERGARGFAWTAATTYGTLIEVLQAVLPWRSAEWADVLVNAMGAALGVWLSRSRT